MSGGPGRRNTLPGFGLTMGLTLTWLSIIVLIPLAGLFIKTFELSWEQFISIVTSRRTLNALKLSFGLALAAAIVNLKRPEWHKRLMLVATAGILQAAIARFFFLAATGGGGPGMRPGVGPPMPVENTAAAGLIVASLVVAAMVHDWRSYGRVHPAYWWGLGAMMTVQLSRPLIAYTESWYRVADFLVAFGG